MILAQISIRTYSIYTRIRWFLCPKVCLKKCVSCDCLTLSRSIKPTDWFIPFGPMLSSAAWDNQRGVSDQHPFIPLWVNGEDATLTLRVKKQKKQSWPFLLFLAQLLSPNETHLPFFHRLNLKVTNKTQHLLEGFHLVKCKTKQEKNTISKRTNTYSGRKLIDEYLLAIIFITNKCT